MSCIIVDDRDIVFESQKWYYLSPSIDYSLFDIIQVVYRDEPVLASTGSSRGIPGIMENLPLLQKRHADERERQGYRSECSDGSAVASQ